MNVSQRCNNPGNIMVARPVGEATDVFRPREGMSIGFAVFPTPQAGWRALVRQIGADQKRGDTIEQFISEYAPKSENDTERYIEVVCEHLRAGRSAKLSDFSPYAIAGIIALHEGYFAP